MKKWMIAAACAALCVPSLASAQEMKAERMTGVHWVMVNMVKFLPGKRERAAEIVEKYFYKAGNDVGGSVIDIHLNTGSWDFITVFPMEGGPGDMSWETSPSDIRFMTALAKYTGGVDGAKKLLAEYQTLISREEKNIAHRHDSLK